MRHRWTAGLILAGAGAVAGFALSPFCSALEIIDERSGRVVHCSRVRTGEEFVLSFVHSVNRRPVYDTLRAEGDHLVIVKSRFDAFGAGMPDTSTQDGTLRVGKDGWLEWSVERPAPQVTVRVGRTADHTLHCKGRDIPLAELAEPGSALTLRVRRASVLRLMKSGCRP